MKKENKIPRKLKKGLSWSAKYAILFDRIFNKIWEQKGYDNNDISDDDLEFYREKFESRCDEVFKETEKLLPKHHVSKFERESGRIMAAWHDECLDPEGYYMTTIDDNKYTKLMNDEYSRMEDKYDKKG
jgi:hypothetical protein